MAYKKDGYNLDLDLVFIFLTTNFRRLVSLLPLYLLFSTANTIHKANTNHFD